MGLASCTKVTFPLPFDVIPESSLFAVNCSRSQGAIDISAPGSRPGCKSGPRATRAVSPVQNGKRYRRRAPRYAWSHRSVTMPRAHKTVRAGETQESQNCQYCNKQRRHHESLPSPRFNHTHCRPTDLARYASCYLSFVKRPSRTSMPIRHSAAISRAISFAHETLGPLRR